MPLFRIKPFRALTLIVLALGLTDVGLIATSGGSASPVTQPVVAAAATTPTELSDMDELREAKRASRSLARTPIHKAHPQPVHHHAAPKPIARPHVAVNVGSAYAWAHTAKAIGVANCESGPGPHAPRYDRYVGDPHLRDPNGHYGKWQFSPSTAYSVGAPGAGIADLSEAQQDYFAWKLWKRDGWGQWECASMV